MEAGRQDAAGIGVEVLEHGQAVPGAGVCVGTLVGADPEGGLRVVYPGQPEAGGLPARTTVIVAPQDAGRQVVLVFEEGDPYRPIVLGLLQARPVRTEDTAADVVGSISPRARRHVRVDGERVQIEARRELVLQCGKSSITLRADGQVYVKGVKIVSRARGLHKIRGANVRIN